MSKVLNKIQDVNPNDSDAVKDAVSTFFSNLPNYTETDCYKWLSALGSVLNRFPKYCAPHRPTIEKYLVHFLDSGNYRNVIEAAKCAHALQQVRPSQDKAGTPKACWRELMLLLCHAAHALMDTLFANSISMHKKSVGPQKHETQVLANTPLTTALQNITKANKTVSDTSQGKKSTVAIRLRNVFVFLQAMLVEIYPVAKPIRPQAVLEVILQAINVSNGGNKKALEEIVGVKIQALRTLDALVICLGSNLVPFSALVFKLAMQTLRWSSENDTEDVKQVRCGAYNSLVRWLKVLHVHKPPQDNRGKSWEDELTEFILVDITPPKQVMELNVNAAIPTKNMSKKAKRKMASTMLQESAIASHMPSEKNKVAVSDETSDELAIAALECAETFLIACGIFLKPSTHKLYQERLVRECYMLDAYNVERGLWLLRTLDSARKSVPPGVPPPTQYCLQLFSSLINHSQSQISQFCSQALLEIRLHLHCSPPSLNFAVEVGLEELNNVDKKRKPLSKRNREVLESLLGAERLPEEVEIITILDEPTSKKLRVGFLPDDDDKISISSTSVKSVEMNDLSEKVDNDTEQQMEFVDSILEENSQTEAIVSRDVIDTTYKTSQIESNECTQEINQGEENENKTDKSSLNIEDNEYTKHVIFLREDSCDTTTVDKTDVSEVTANTPNNQDVDDRELPCGQTDSSQDTMESINEQNTEKQDEEQAPKQNGIHSSPEKQPENAEVNVQAKIVSSQAVGTNDSLTVEDMLADFVDEVIE